MTVLNQAPPHRLRAIVACALLVGTAPASGTVSARQAPLPDVKVVAAEVRKHLLSDRELQSQYTFIERRREIKVSWLGKVSDGPVNTYEVYPSVEPGNNYKRLVAVNGRPIPAAELERQDRKHRDDLLRDMKARERESPSDRATRDKRDARERVEREATLDDIFALYDIRLVGRERLDGHDTLVATLEPKPRYRPRTEAGGLLTKIRARVWVSEADSQVIKIDAEMIDDVTFGWGIAAKLYKGSRAMFERTKVNGEVWLPSRASITGAGRVLLFRRFSIDSVTTFSDYKKFSVKTEEATGTIQ